MLKIWLDPNSATKQAEEPKIPNNYQMAAVGDTVTYDSGTYESVGTQRPNYMTPEAAQNGDWIKQLPPEDAVPGVVHKIPEFWQRKRKDFYGI